MPHGPGPRSDHAVGGDVALVDDAQRCQQLGLRPGAAAPFVRQGGQCVHRAEGAKVAAVVALHAPDGGDDAGRHAVAGGCGLQCCAVRRQLGLTLGNALGRDGAVQVRPRGAGELGLGAVQLDHAGQPLCLAEHVAHSGGANAGLQRLGRKGGQPLGKAGGVVSIGAGLRLCGGWGGRGRLCWGRRGRRHRFRCGCGGGAGG